MRKLTRLATGLLGAAATLAAAAAAGASPIPIKTLLSDFNVITDNTFANGGPDVQGPVLVGGNFTSNSATLNSNVIIPLPVPLPPGDVLGEVNVFGNTTLSGGVPVQNSLTLVGGSNTGVATFLNPGAGSVLALHNFAPINFASDIWAQLTGYSTTLMNLPTNTPTPSTFNSTTGTFTFHANNGVANVTVTGAALAMHGVGNLTFDGLPAGGLAVVDVLGGYTDPGSQFAPGAAFSNLLFNFIGGNPVDLSTWGASVLAVGTTVTTTNVLTGDVVADNLATGDETHVNFPDCPASVCTPTVVSEPGSLTGLGAALALLSAAATVPAVRGRRRWSHLPPPAAVG